ncbi:putative beta-glucosidase [Lupinus albus]|uniref:Putative beta-glucosidase n=1 Tax=Lupinus albus TaxID=3870 RepID=A0A6A4NY01_LUPAL|nr:putative beta-glucosidase [Lupinus albus]
MEGDHLYGILIHILLITDFSNADVAVDHYHRFEVVCFNEPHTFVTQGFDTGIQAPGRCSILRLCKAGNSSTEPYIVAHNVLRSHVSVADIYRKKYKVQGGSLGVAFNVIWFENATNTQKDIDASQRAQDFQLGWFLDPLMFGDYPSSMRSSVGNRLPKFSEADVALVKGSLDFVGINHYTTFYARDNSTNVVRTVLHDSLANSGTITLRKYLTQFSNSVGGFANSIWLYIVPQGMRSLMNYIKQKYGNPPVVITENGMDDPNSPFTSVKDALKDEKRIRYLNSYLSELLASIKDGCNVKGHFVWSVLYNWEWSAGYSSRFGLYFVDYKDNLKRYPKQSVEWYKNFLEKK